MERTSMFTSRYFLKIQTIEELRHSLPNSMYISVYFVVLDAGSGHATATCSGGVLRLKLRNTKRIKDITKIQYAARSKTRWTAGDHPMNGCDMNRCRLSDGGTTVEVDVPNSHGYTLTHIFSRTDKELNWSYVSVTT